MWTPAFYLGNEQPPSWLSTQRSAGFWPCSGSPTPMPGIVGLFPYSDVLKSSRSNPTNLTWISRDLCEECVARGGCSLSASLGSIDGGRNEQRVARNSETAHPEHELCHQRHTPVWVTGEVVVAVVVHFHTQEGSFSPCLQHPFFITSGGYDCGH